MNRSEWKERLPLIQAFVEGKTIEMKYHGDNFWITAHTPEFNFSCALYRIKPEPKVIWLCTGTTEVFTSDIMVEKYLSLNCGQECTKYVEVVE